MIVKFFYSKSATIGVMKDKIRILHINDLHSHFEQYPQLKRAVDDLSQTDRELIKVDLGDNVDKSHPLSDVTAGRFNIALMNELSIIFSRIGINTYDVLEAAGTKWNFLKFYPGLVGGHCIGVDPYYLVYKANELKYHTQIISAGRFINDTMGGYIAKKLVKKMIGMGKNILGARVLVMGMTFKENVADIRNSKVVDIINELKDFGVDVDVVDPYADSEEVKQMYGFKLIEKPRNNYDGVIVAVSHDAYLNLDEKYFKSLTYENAVLVDVKGMYRGKINELKYWSL